MRIWQNRAPPKRRYWPKYTHFLQPKSNPEWRAKRARSLQNPARGCAAGTAATGKRRDRSEARKAHPAKGCARRKPVMPSGYATIAGVDVSTDHFIAGRRVSSKQKFANHSPIDGAHLADISSGGKTEIDQAVAAARAAFPAWAALGAQGRAPILKRFAEGILARANDLAIVETTDNGSLLSGNQQRLVPRTALNISFFADYALTLGHHVIDHPEADNHVRYDPAGVAALITPWNGPMMLTSWKLGPTLAAGNTVVVKPPEWAPLTCSLLADIAQAAGVPD